MASSTDSMRIAFSTLVGIAFTGLAQAIPYTSTRDSLIKSTYSNANTSLTLLYQNNLNASDDANHIGAILLDPASPTTGAAQCAALGESLVAIESLDAHRSDFEHALTYLAYAGLVSDASGDGGASQEYYVQEGVLTVTPSTNGSSSYSFHFAKFYSSSSKEQKALPILCTQSSSQNSATNAIATAQNEVRIPAPDDNTFVGFRNQKSFRFLGIPYANPLKRFEYSSVFNATGQTIDATQYGASCAQAGEADSSEDCLFLNIQTPYIPKAWFGSGSGNNDSKFEASDDVREQKLKPVMFGIHGGGFTGGNGGPTSGLDGGNMASREDIVSVQLNYRLSTLGFLAIPGTDIRGNYGIGDQITALRWIKKNIASFGGDPNKVTIIGESAGAGSVRVLLGSPPVIREKLISGGVAQSNLGGGVALGLTGDYATTYSTYYTIDQSYAVAGQQIFAAAGCNQSTTITSIQDEVACLAAVNASTLVDLPTVARYVVQDGTIVDTEQLIVTSRNGSQAYVPIIFGTTENDGASFCLFPEANTTSEVEGIAYSLSITEAQAQRVVDSGLFPYYDSGNLTLDTFNVSQRVATDLQFRCIDEATVYAAAVSGAFPTAFYYNQDRTYEGYDPLALGPSLNGGDDAEAPYFRLHGSDLGFTYGNQDPLRDERDLEASQLVSGYFASFTKTGSPNPDERYLEARGYESTLAAIRETGLWEAVSDQRAKDVPVGKQLDYPAVTVEFPDRKQCGFLNYSLEYYLDGGI
ncbi:Carboxylesterase family-domain-containing protein [Coniella lustricola]|uniref:Carboxylesterase family-domain-containing protein n=1 Tax=Coniella lustricola TaxID=2025994 RepID=A0A2T3AAD3_9PEZI|nr:Carboxylesterase family-domain-containing protein [Coniella lustricola]